MVMQLLIKDMLVMTVSELIRPFFYIVNKMF